MVHDRDVVPLRDAARAWWAISWQTFGGPAGQIAVMHRSLVTERRWIGEQRFLFALAYCTLLPGPEAQQLATYTGWLLNGTRGAVMAGALFVLPGMVTLLALSAVIVGWSDTPLLESLLAGLTPALVAVVALAVATLARRALVAWPHRLLALGSFAALALFGTPFPLVIAVAAVVGLLLPPIATPPAKASDGLPAPLVPDEELHHQAPPPLRRQVGAVLVWLVAWLAPLGVVAAVLGLSSTVTRQGGFFAATAVITVGGAYAVLSWVAHQAVEVHGWLSAEAMTRGLALGESTPGPLIMVVQYVAFLGAWADPGPLDPWVAAVLASLLVTWVTFVPSIAFVVLGAPWVERLRGSRPLKGTLAGVSAAVVGVMAHLGWWLAEQTLVADSHRIDDGPWNLVVPDLSRPEWPAIALASLAGLLLARRGWSVLRTLALCGALGAASSLLALV